LLHEEKITDSKMTLLSNKKQRNSLLAKKKSFIGLAPEQMLSEELKSKEF